MCNTTNNISEMSLLIFKENNIFILNYLGTYSQVAQHQILGLSLSGA